MSIKLFWKENCPYCPQAKEVCEKLQKQGMYVEYLDIDTIDGMAEANFYGIMSTPTVIIVDKEGNEIASWHGQIPDEHKIIKLLNKN